MRYVAFDTETWLIAPGRLAPPLVCVSWCEGSQSGLLGADAGTAFVRGLLQDKDVCIVAHNAPFDFGVLVQRDPSLMPLIWQAYDEGRVFDTQVFEKLRKIALGWFRINPNTGRNPRWGLAPLVEEYLGESVEGKDKEDAWRYRYQELDGKPLSEWPAPAREYAILDAQYTYRLCERQRAEWTKVAKQRGWDDPIPDLLSQTKYAWSLHLMSAWGIRTDADMVCDLERDLRSAVNKAMESLKRTGIYRANGTKDVKKVRAMVGRAYAALGKEVPLTPNKAIKTSLAVLQASEDPDLQELAAISGEQKLLNTFIPILKSGIERPINCNFNVLVASGRTSCSKPNLQNQPRREGIRDCYIPRDGYVFAACDYHVAELCSLAQILVDKYDHSEMAEAIRSGKDLHLVTASNILNITFKQTKERFEKGDKEVKRARQLSKALNFGLPGGLGADRFRDFAKASYGLEIDRTEAADLKSAWLDSYPEMVRYFQDIGKQGDAFTFEQPRSGRLRGDVGFCDGCNSGFQGLTADGAKRALHEVVRQCYLDCGTDLYGSRPVAFIHDEIILEVPEASAAEAAEQLARVMVSEMQVLVPDIPIHADAHLMRRWYKGAEPVRDGSGKLIPWEPEA